MPKFLFEIGCEEIPARFVQPLLDQIVVLFLKSLEEKRVSYSKKSLELFSTYRRLAFRLELDAVQLDSRQRVTGPPLAISRSENGSWLPPAIGFSKKVGVDLDQIETAKDEKGRDILVVTQFSKGQNIAMLLPDILQHVFANLSLPIAMRWADKDESFIRPVHWVLAMLDSEVVNCVLFDQVSGATSYGHRFLSEGATLDGELITLKHVDDYESDLKSVFVWVSREKRQALIEAALHNYHQKTFDQNLLYELVQLVEWPTPLVCSFETKYLNLPDCVLVQSMIKHQRYFPLYEGDKLTSNFLIIADNVNNNEETIMEGNQRVIRSRLEDAVFFFEEDQKKSLDFFKEKLCQVVYQAGLGSMLDKTKRIEILACFLNDKLEAGCQHDLLKRVSELCKLDLVTQMVVEFPGLQGYMGAVYASIKQESLEVVQAIHEQYWPVAPLSKVPESKMAAIIGLADRLDNIVCCFQNNSIPTGSKDPLGVRRALLGMLAILDRWGWSLSFSDAFSKAYDILDKGINNRDKLELFFIDRLTYFLESKGYSYDEVGAVATLAVSDFKSGLLALEWLSKERRENETQFKILVETAVRVKRLALKAPKGKVNPKLFEKKIETNVFELLSNNKNILNLYVFSEPLTQYFEEVLVMDKDENKRNNRLIMLAQINQRYQWVADFEKIVF